MTMSSLATFAVPSEPYMTSVIQFVNKSKRRRMQDLLLAGFFAACGSLFGKLSGGEYGILLRYPFLQTLVIEQSLNCLQSIFLILMIACNVLNWRHFLKALQSTEQTLTATVMSAAANYIFSFLFGVFFFGEMLSMLSLLGAVSIVIGLCFLCTQV